MFLNFAGCSKRPFGPLKVNRQTVKIQRKSRFNGHLRLKLTSKPAQTHPGLVWLGLVPCWPGISRAVSPSPLTPNPSWQLTVGARNGISTKTAISPGVWPRPTRGGLMAYSMSVWNHRGPLDRLSGCQRTPGSWGFFIPTAFLKAGEPQDFFGLAHLNEHRTAVLTHYCALESASAGRGCDKTVFFDHPTPRFASKTSSLHRLQGQR